jgi:hypothetical protein
VGVIYKIPRSSNLSLGGANSNFQIDGAGTTPIEVTLNTETLGSTLIVPQFCQFTNLNVPTDNKGNGTYSVLHDAIGYNGGLFPGFGLRLCSKTNIGGGSSHTLSATKNSNFGLEATMIAIEVKNGATIIAPAPVTRAAVGAGVALAAASITTTGPAMLIAIWGGDGASGQHDANPDGAWTKGQGLNLPDTFYIQAWTATRFVASAGTYTCTWTPTGNEGAILAMVAVQA